MQRRSFLGSILAAGMAPAIVKAGILMPLAPRILVPSPLLLTSPLAMRIGINPQEFRIYNTYTDAGNWERMLVDYSGRIIKGAAC